MPYRVKEIFYSLQGEGAWTGRAAVFCRFSGCNLWSGRPEARLTSPCPFCDTDFNGTNGDLGGEYPSAEALVEAVASAYIGSRDQKTPMVILTGGEPLLQVDEELLNELHRHDFFIACETNGTLKAPDGIDWLTVSPKAGTKILQKKGSELKVVFPHTGFDFAAAETWGFQHRFVQPCYTGTGDTDRDNVAAAIRFCLKNPSWRLSLQMHRLTGIR